MHLQEVTEPKTSLPHPTATLLQDKTRKPVMLAAQHTGKLVITENDANILPKMNVVSVELSF